MTINEFLDAFEAKFKTEQPEVRLKYDRGIQLLRVVHPLNKSERWSMCPVEFLAGEFGANSVAGPKLGLTSPDTNRIIYAADFRCYPYDERYPIRQRLLEIMGVKEAEEEIDDYDSH